LGLPYTLHASKHLDVAQAAATARLSGAADEISVAWALKNYLAG